MPTLPPSPRNMALIAVVAALATAVSVFAGVGGNTRDPLPGGGHNKANAPAAGRTDGDAGAL